jgi:hypothetical protein
VAAKLSWREWTFIQSVIGYVGLLTGVLHALMLLMVTLCRDQGLACKDFGSVNPLQQFAEWIGNVPPSTYHMMMIYLITLHNSTLSNLVWYLHITSCSIWSYLFSYFVWPTDVSCNEDVTLILFRRRSIIIISSAPFSLQLLGSSSRFRWSSSCSKCSFPCHQSHGVLQASEREIITTTRSYAPPSSAAHLRDLWQMYPRNRQRANLHLMK